MSTTYECDECRQTFEVGKFDNPFKLPFPLPDFIHYYRDGDEPCFGRLLPSTAPTVLDEALAEERA